jgi:hypothetical protein
VHFDTAAPHRSAEIEKRFQWCHFRHVLQPLYNSGISPWDFFLFGDLKPKLKDEEFETMEELQWKVQERLGQTT